MGRKVVMLLIVAVAVVGVQPAIGQTIPLAEWQTLVALYESTQGHSWSNRTGWKKTGHGPDASECTWYGITCDSAPHVTQIELLNNNLIGQLPDLSGLTELTLLNVGDNKLTGSLPTSVSVLSHLITLDVEVNNLSGGLEVLNGLAELQEFEGYQNAFTGTLPNLSTMPNLLYLGVEDNLLTGQIPSLTGNPSLSYFNVINNYLSGSVPPLDNLHNLQDLYISANRLTGVMPNPPEPNLLNYGAVILCPNYFAPIDNAEWDALHGNMLWYSQCDADTIFNDGFGAPPSLQ